MAGTTAARAASATAAGDLSGEVAFLTRAG